MKVGKLESPMSQSESTPRFFRIARWIGIIGVSILVLNFFYQLYRLHEKKNTQATLSTCNLQQSGSCTRNLPNQQILRFTVSPTPMKSNQTIQATVSLTGPNPENITLLVFPYPPKGPHGAPSIMKKESDGKYHGNFSLETNPAEIPQEWIALLILRQGDTNISVPFHFRIQ